MRFNSNIKWIFVLFLLATTVLVACKNDNSDKRNKPVNYKALEKQLLEANSQLVILEDEYIKKFIKDKDWEMNETGSGLRWMLIEEGEGERAVPGQFASLEYKVFLLSGQQIYSSESAGIKSFEIGHGGVESGLEEGILFLKLGDKARFVLPSHLAYGLQGDGKSVPPRTSLVYEVKLIDLK